jgi:hypothetical protein
MSVPLIVVLVLGTAIIGAGLYFLRAVRARLREEVARLQASLRQAKVMRQEAGVRLRQSSGSDVSGIDCTLADDGLYCTDGVWIARVCFGAAQGPGDFKLTQTPRILDGALELQLGRSTWLVYVAEPHAWAKALILASRSQA